MTTTKTRPRSLTLQLAAAVEEVETSTESREISGLAVPFGPVGYSSLGPITFAAGSITWAEQIGRVKLLEQHDPDRVVGFATALEETPEGLRATFQVADGPEGDKALAMVADGRRDGLSVGVMLSEDSLAEVFDKWMEGDTSATAVSGVLLETSLVTLPAFDDARSDGSAAYAAAAVALNAAMAASGDSPRHLTLAVPTWGAGDTKENRMPPTSAPAAPAPAEAAGTPTPQTPAPVPEHVPAAAGAALEVSEAPVYTFDGRGPSFVRDVYHARFSADPEATARLAKFQSAMAEGGAQMAAFLTAAVETRTTEPVGISSDNYRPEMLIQAIDKGRPLVSRIGTVRIDNATPFRIPIEGEFTGVGDHTEGTAHVAEGTLALTDTTVTPGAVSGAYRISRELVDAYNPAIDQIAVRAMMRDYRKVTEAKTLAALAAADTTPTFGINTVAELRTVLNAYSDIDDLPADLVAMGTGFYSDLLAEVDTTGRPMLPFVGPTNAVGTTNPGYTGASVDGVELVKVSSINGAVTKQAYAFRTEHVFIGESPVQTFRFEEIEGPGVIKLALWAYFVAKVTRPAGVVRISSAAS